MLAETIRTGLRGGFIKPSDLERVNVDTTVQEKNVRFPTDARLLDRSRERLVKRARARGIVLRQTYVRVGKRALRKQSGYAHAKQFKRARREENRLRTYLGQVVRDIERKCNGAAWELSGELKKARRPLAQKKTDSNKSYSLHEPQVECIAKGKAHKRYEFGFKAGFVSPAKSNWIPGARAFHGNPYDGHTLASALGQSGRLTGVAARQATCDLGYRGHDCTGECEVRIVKRHRKGIPRAMRRWWKRRSAIEPVIGHVKAESRMDRKRRSAIEPVIGHVKAESRMDRNRLGGSMGDKLNAILAACGFNLRKLLRGFAHLPRFWRFLRGVWRRLGLVSAAPDENPALAA